MSLKEYLDQEEEVSEEIVVSFEYSSQTKEVFKKVYLDFYYWVRGNLERVEEFLGLIREVKKDAIEP